MAVFVLSLAARIVAAIIMIQTLFFKFTGAAESVYIFTKVGMESWGRYGVGIAELIAAVLILIPRTAGFGALLTVGLMVGAIAMHILFLGIEVQNDGGQLFIYAVVVFACGFYTLWINRRLVQQDISRLFGK
jgi:hypothetical protein